MNGYEVTLLEAGQVKSGTNPVTDEKMAISFKTLGKFLLIGLLHTFSLFLLFSEIFEFYSVIVSLQTTFDVKVAKNSAFIRSRGQYEQAIFENSFS